MSILQAYFFLFTLFQAVIDRGVVLGFYEADGGNDTDKAKVENFFTDAAKNFNLRTSGRLKEMIKL